MWGRGQVGSAPLSPRLRSRALYGDLAEASSMPDLAAGGVPGTQ